MVSRDWMEKDFYKVLGVPKDAPTADIKKAYRQLARDLHPDHNPGNTGAEDRFKEVSEAYTVLADDKKRREYDEMRSLLGAGAFRRDARMGGGATPFDLNDLLNQARGGGGFGGTSPGGDAGGFGDIFGNLFGQGRRRSGPAKGRDVEAAVVLEFADAVKGTTLPLTLRAPGVCDTCHGDGARPGTTPETCQTCHGLGMVTTNQGAFSFSEPCKDCQGVGTIVRDKCPECKGSGGVTKTRTLTVRIPAGVDNGQKIRLAGRGEPGERGGPTGDLYVLITVRPHEYFERKGDNLVLRVPVTFPEAALGTDVRVPTLDGPVTVRVPAGTPSGRTLRVRGRGVPLRDGSPGGDLLVTVEIEVPAELSPEARETLEKFATQVPPAGRHRLEDRITDETG
ncbi:molecular chaperone DnaJ [Phytomonospora endophytica]|uniref:Chaperone protein DnaJ n=1 Tax=Phytomonospora endophytica TaxID=714109 RepID=A0A841FJB3_9ACTN|nr:molecular chaperone DnaJ [Phytomonospora endophytica]MBB6035964.1 molecular chaperone DnaJ [Phytomonospora endophytica]GIG66870.1 chaperone protein DnaJ 1 [Phytomonospora endophytica]